MGVRRTLGFCAAVWLLSGGSSLTNKQMRRYHAANFIAQRTTHDLKRGNDACTCERDLYKTTEFSSELFNSRHKLMMSGVDEHGWAVAECRPYESVVSGVRICAVVAPSGPLRRRASLISSCLAASCSGTVSVWVTRPSCSRPK